MSKIRREKTYQLHFIKNVWTAQRFSRIQINLKHKQKQNVNLVVVYDIRNSGGAGDTALVLLIISYNIIIFMGHDTYKL